MAVITGNYADLTKSKEYSMARGTQSLNYLQPLIAPPLQSWDKHRRKSHRQLFPPWWAHQCGALIIYIYIYIWRWNWHCPSLTRACTTWAMWNWLIQIAVHSTAWSFMLSKSLLKDRLSTERYSYSTITKLSTCIKVWSAISPRWHWCSVLL